MNKTIDKNEIIGSTNYSLLITEAIRTRDKSLLSELANLRIRCRECSAEVNAVETKITSTGMDCPRCGKPWFMMAGKK